jgi:hypothetical protein
VEMPRSVAVEPHPPNAGSVVAILRALLVVCVGVTLLPPELRDRLRLALTAN